MPTVVTPIAYSKGYRSPECTIIYKAKTIEEYRQLRDEQRNRDMGEALGGLVVIALVIACAVGIFYWINRWWW